jgi:hypothetical protein
LRPLTLQGHLLQPVASLGLALPGPRLAGEVLLAAADQAMYDAKQGTGIHLYTSTNPPGRIDRSATARRAARQREHPPHRAYPRPQPSGNVNRAKRRMVSGEYAVLASTGRPWPPVRVPTSSAAGLIAERPARLPRVDVS